MPNNGNLIRQYSQTELLAKIEALGFGRNVTEVVDGGGTTVQIHQDDDPRIGGSIILPLTFWSTADIAPQWDQADRDAWLRSFWPRFGNDILQSVLAVSIAKVQTQNFVMEGPEKKVQFYHGRFVDGADFGRGYGQMIARGVTDYYTQDNGWFIERHRSGPNDHKGPCLGLSHLDSARMFPTGNAEYPYAYLDVEGEYHIMHRSQLIRIVDMPTPAVNKNGWDRGFCALSRALSTAMILTLLVQMKREKLSDLPPSALAIFNNVSRKQFESALNLYGLKEEAKGNEVWRSILPLFGIDPAHPAGVDFISLREVWEGFDEMTAYNVAVYSFAAAWRMDPREFWPVSQGPLGTGKEAEVQHQKAKAKSTGLIFTELERAFNSDLTLPPDVKIRFQLQDIDEEEQRANIHSLQIKNVEAMQKAGANLSVEEVRFLLSNQYKVLPRIMATPPGEGEVFVPGEDFVWMDDVDRQTKEAYKEFWGPFTVIDSTGRVTYVEKGYKVQRESAVPFVGVKGGKGSGNWSHAGRPGKRGGSSKNGLHDRLELLKGDLASAANSVLDDYDPDFNFGGICDDVCSEMMGVLSENGIDCIIGGQEGSDHAYIIAYDEQAEQAFEVDIPPDVYESGGGYAWEIDTDANITPNDVIINKVPDSDLQYVVPEVFDGDKQYTIPDTIPKRGAGFGNYGKRMREGVRGLWLGEFGYMDFIDHMSFIRTDLRRAWMEGWKECSPEGYTGELTTDAELKLTEIINNEWNYLISFAEHVVEHDKSAGYKLAPHLVRAEMWALTYLETKNTALTYCPNNPNQIWQYGATKDHCTDALRLHGRVYKAETWKKWGVVPQSRELECGGWRCACTLTVTDQPVTPGKPPALTGQREMPWWRDFSQEVPYEVLAEFGNVD